MADTTIANTAYEPMEVDVAKEPRRWVSAWNVKATILKYRVALFLSLAALVVVIILAATGVFSSSSNSSNSANSSDVAPTIAGNFTVFHAGSLVSLMDKIVAPAFLTASGYAAQLHAKGSVALANEIKNHSIADVFISADASVNTNVLMGSANGDLANWYVAFGRTSLGLGYSTASPYVDVFESVANGSLEWYDALMANPSIKIGRTDPDLDPKGYRTVMVMNLAEKHYNKTGLGATILGNATNRQQIFTEENLEKYVTAGDLDVGFFYEVEVSELSEVKFLALPAEIDMSDPALNSLYASASYTNAKSGQVYNGSASVYTVTIPTTANHTAAATSFVKYLISEAGQNLLVQHGMKKTTLTAYPNKSAVPAEIVAMLP